MTRALRFPTRREIRDVSRLALPIIVVQIGLMLMGVVDAAMVGRVSPEALAAVALGNLYWFQVVVLGQGTLMALDPVVAQAVGAGDSPAIARALQRGVLLAIAISAVASLLLIPSEAVLRALGQPAEVVPTAADFVTAGIPGVLPFLLFVVLRQTLQAFQMVRPIVVAVVVANLVNAGLDWILVFGNVGAPALGAVGSAYASAISRWLMFVMLLAVCWRTIRPFLRLRRDSWAAGPLAKMLWVGLPIGVQLWIEFAAFGAGLVLVGLLGAVPLAGHQIALTIAATTYMVPLGLSAAGAVLVGHAIGRGDAEAARREASAALACGVGFMSATAIVLLSVPRLLGRLFTDDPAVLAVAAALIPIAGVFQVFDGVQGVSSGILRGAGDTRVPMLLNLAGYALAGLPLGAWLCFARGWGASGIWWGFVTALVAVAAALGWRVHTRLGGTLERIDVEELKVVAG